MLFRKLEDKINLIYNKKSVVFFAFLLIGFFIIFLRLLYLQIINYDKYKKIADNNRIRVVRVKADRGFIYDRNNNIVVKNKPSYNLYLVREDIEDKDNLLNLINQKIPIDKELIEKRLKKAYYYQEVLAYRGLTFEELSYFSENIEDLQGVNIKLDPVRDYLDSTSMSHIIGYLGETTEQDLKTKQNYFAGDLIGKTGVEYFYEDILRGKDGKKFVEVDSLGQTINTIEFQPPVNGKSLRLSVDYRLQKFAQKLFGNKRGSIVVEDIQTGELILLFSSPTYDLNEFIPYITEENWDKLIKDNKKPLLNRAIESHYPPGSIFKILMALIGLKEKAITPDSKFFCNGKLEFGNYEYKCWKTAGHGDVDLKKGISESCDVYFYNLGLQLGIDKISEYAKRFKLGEYTNVDIPNEKKGVFPNRDWKKNAFNQIWFPGETIIASIGQGYISVTPIQLVNMFAGIFNGGKILKPHIVKSIIDDNEEILTKTEVYDYITIPEKIKKSILDGMTEAVYGRHGTSYRARVESITIAGKTGTAQVVSLKKTEKYDDDKIPEKYRDHSWFAAVFPAEQPQYALIAMVEHGGSGSQSAAALAGAIINKMVDLKYVSD
ncbi:MAG: peptidoglycan glycosyltransferase [Deferribacteraceae bacterium]|nr:peptidoglycan glycosyltransferase [Deferribacteraceae bacterium]